jgi:hypothetical protein
MKILVRLLCAIMIALGCAQPAYAQLGSVPTTFSPGQTMRSAPVNTMFAAIYANALNRTGGTMTGTLTTLSVLPTADNTSDLGSLALSYRNAWIEGTLTVGTVSATTISGGLGSLTSLIQTTLTTQQLSLRYDASNHLAVTVASNGATTINATGAGASVIFSDAVTFSGNAILGANFLSGDGGNEGVSVDSGGIVSVSSSLKERGRSTAMGEWANQAFSAGEYTASASTWGVDSGDVTTNRYMLVGKTVTWQLVIANTDVGGTPVNLRVAVPGSLTEASLTRGGACGYTKDSVTAANNTSYWIMDGSGYVKLQLSSSSNWTTTTGDDTSISCTITFEIA